MSPSQVQLLHPEQMLWQAGMCCFMLLLGVTMDLLLHVLREEGKEVILPWGPPGSAGNRVIQVLGSESWVSGSWV